ncbi:MAG TPA: hypothetical protein GX717_08765 [Clostridiaceae bacterium]|nr:hypothetical protein [Clostridiaceae bacterium]
MYLGREFYHDHVRMYRRRPIYWQLDSGRAGGFRALVYMRDWEADTIGHVRVVYLHPLQRVYENEIRRVKEVLTAVETDRQKNVAAKRLQTLMRQFKEVTEYDSRLARLAYAHRSVHLDDGVEYNYAEVQKTSYGETVNILSTI